MSAPSSASSSPSSLNARARVNHVSNQIMKQLAHISPSRPVTRDHPSQHSPLNNKHTSMESESESESTPHIGGIGVYRVHAAPIDQHIESRNYYEILNIDMNATTAEITRAYRTLALTHHPDKLTPPPTPTSTTTTTPSPSSKSKTLHTIIAPTPSSVHDITWNTIQQAYDILKDDNKRKEYDRQQQAINDTLSRPLSISEEVDLDDLFFDNSTCNYRYDCRCGDTIIVPHQSLSMDYDVYSCGSCSCTIRVMYDNVAGTRISLTGCG